MKRLWMVLAVVLVLGLAGISFAYGDEITWQGFSWGMSFEDVVQAFLDKEMLTDELTEYPEEFIAMSYLMDDTNGFLRLDEQGKVTTNYDTGAIDTSKVGSHYDAYSNYLSLENIAGYKVGTITFNFVKNGDSTYLISVQIPLNVSEIGTDAAEEDLVAKLSSIYGNPENGELELLTGRKEKSFYWIGENNTCVWMGNYGLQSEYLIYGTLDAARLFKDAENGLPVENHSVDANNMNGL